MNNKKFTASDEIYGDIKMAKTNIETKKRMTIDKRIRLTTYLRVFNFALLVFFRTFRSFDQTGAASP